MENSWKAMDLNRFVVKDDMIDYVLHKYESNWQVHDAIADDINDLLKREEKQIMHINKGKEKMVMERGSDHNPFQATSDESSDHKPFQVTYDESSNDTLKSSSEDT
ncbi:hypothetical protein Tco_0948982, partial [Tanacetum coccineum]